MGRTEDEHNQALFRLVNDKSILKTELVLLEVNNILSKRGVQLVLFTAGPKALSKVSSEIKKHECLSY